MSSTDQALGGRWEPAVRERLLGMLSDAQIAVFDFDNTCIRGDIGERFHRYMSEAGHYSTRGLATIEVPDGRERIANADDHATKGEEWVAAYWRRYRRLGKGSAYEWQTQALAGLTEAEAKLRAREAVAAGLAERCEVTTRRCDDGFEFPWSSGIRTYPEMIELMDTLRASRCEVWLCSASPKLLVEEFAGAHYGVPADRVIGGCSAKSGDELTETVLQPYPYRGGKAELVGRHIGVPDLVFGDSSTDFEMMALARMSAVLIDHGDQATGAHADASGWLRQPAFHRVG